MHSVIFLACRPKIYTLSGPSTLIFLYPSFFGSPQTMSEYFDLLNKSIKEISLDGLLDVYPKMLKGETSGRYIVNVNK